MRSTIRRAIGAALLCGAVTGFQAGAAKADGAIDAAADPFAGLQAMAPETLSEMNGRQGANLNMITNMLTGAQSFDIESANVVEAGSMTSGQIGLNNSFTGARGVNVMAANTGMGANIQNGLILLINMY